MKFYTVREVAIMLNLHPETIRRYIARGRLRAYKTGKEWRIKESELKRYLKMISNK